MITKATVPSYRLIAIGVVDYQTWTRSAGAR